MSSTKVASASLRPAAGHVGLRDPSAASEAIPAWLIHPPGPVPYLDANRWMHELAERRLCGEIPDTLILLEHPPVYTAGKRWKTEHLRWSVQAMEAAGAEFHAIDRGGSVTFHGPGQLVGYPILDLGLRPDVARYVRDLEEVVIQACADAGIEGLGRDPVNSGVWADDRKVCAIGVRVMRMRVTLHGFALNCATDPRWFDAIVPCGLEDHGVTSLTDLAGREVGVGEMFPRVVRRFETVFGRTLRATPAP